MTKKMIFTLTVCLFLFSTSSAWAYYIPDTGDLGEPACNPRSYTDNGDGTIKDNVTGLEWQQASKATGSTWHNAPSKAQETFVGKTGWRLPTVQELATLVDLSQSNPAIDPLFDMASETKHWSFTPKAAAITAWHVDFEYGDVNVGNTTDTLSVRAVRGPYYQPMNALVVNGDGTVSDLDTGLMWQQCNAEQTWGGTQCTDSVFPQSWNQAVTYIERLNNSSYLGYDDWRLPTRNELQSLLDYSLYNPATTFPLLNIEDAYWSSTIWSGSSLSAWGVIFKNNPSPGGYVSAYEKETSFYIRAVRSGVCWISEKQCLDDVDCVNGWPCVEGLCVCQNDAQCDDSVTCNGDETCDSGACTPGTTTCAEGEYCYEAEDHCVECLNNTHCGTMEKCKTNICVPRGEIQIDKSSVKAGKRDDTDKIKLSGLLDAYATDFTAEMGGDVIVSLLADYIPDPGAIEYTFEIKAEDLDNGTYTSPKIKSADKTDPVTSFSCDTNTGTMKFSGKNLDLTGLSCPITLRVQIGAYSATVEMNEDIVNGPKKPCPLQLLMGVYDSLDVTKEKAKKSTKADSDSLSISGTFTIDGTFDMNEPLVITLGSDTFTVPGGEFVVKKSSYSCKSYDTGNGLVTAKFDTVKCTFSLSIKNTTLSDSGPVDFALNVFDNSLTTSAQIELPPDP